MEVLQDGFAVAGDYFRQTFTRKLYSGVLALAKPLAQGESTSMQLALATESVCPLQETLAFINRLFALALLEEQL